jgi:hypothetical protein
MCEEVLYLISCDTTEGFPQLVGRSLILHDVNQEIDECFKRHSAVVLQKLVIDVVHILVGVYNSQTRQGGCHFRLAERVRFIPIEISKCGFKLFQLRGRQVCHIARDNLPAKKMRSAFYPSREQIIWSHLIVNKRDLLDDTLHDKLQLEFQILASEYRVVVLLYISGVALGFGSSHSLQGIGQCRYSCLNLLDLLLLSLQQTDECCT